MAGNKDLSTSISVSDIVFLVRGRESDGAGMNLPSENLASRRGRRELRE